MAREANITRIAKSVWLVFPHRDELYFGEFLDSYSVSYAPKYPDRTDDDWSAHIESTTEELGKVVLLQNIDKGLGYNMKVLKEYDDLYYFLADLKKMNERGVHNVLCEIKAGE